MASSDFTVRNGLVVNTNLIYAPAGGGRIGINNTSPTANLTLTGSMLVSGNVTFSNTLTVAGAVTFANQISFSGNGSFTSGIAVTGNASFSSVITVGGNAAITGSETVGGNLSVSGVSSFSGNSSFNSNMTVTGSGTFGSLYANIIYDTSNNSYFLDPSSTSRTGTINSDILRSYGAAYATVLYDQDDTNWYVDPNSRSRINSLTMNVGQWLQSTENFNRLQFANGDATYLSGGNTAQWWIRFGTQDNDSRAIFEGAGNFYTTGNITAYWSDKRLKKNINRISDWREIMNSINGYRFEWNELGKKFVDEDGVQVGLIAQEVEGALPQAASVQMLQYKDKKDGVLIPRDDINYDPNKPYLTVREEKIIPVLVEAIKGLMAEIDELKKAKQ